MTLDRHQIDRLLTEVGALRPSTGGPGFTSCFLYIDPIIEVHLAYAGGHAVSVWIPLGCPGVTNGDLGASTPRRAFDRLAKSLLYLTRPRGRAREGWRTGLEPATTGTTSQSSTN